MTYRRYYVEVDKGRCTNCNFCELVCKCYSPNHCVGCLACFWACPYEARKVKEEYVKPRFVEIYVDKVKYRVPANLTVSKALEYIGFKFEPPGSEGISLPCKTGGCWSCALLIDGVFERSCITPIRDGMEIITNVKGIIPRRIVHGPEPHLVGGKGTPWWEVNYREYVEAAIWVAGCNLRCPQCQNYHVTYDNVSKALTPKEAAEEIVRCHSIFNTKGVAISGGEPTLNRRWLKLFFEYLSKSLKPKVRKHLDSNGTLLSPDYIDELIESGCNDFGVEPKCIDVKTYMKITGLSSKDEARRYLENSWKAVEYIYDRYREKAFLGVGLIYNDDLVSLREIERAGDKIRSIDPNIQVTVLDYFPSFRRRNLVRPTVERMLEVKKVLESCGLKCVIVQTRSGHIGPKGVKRG